MIHSNFYIFSQKIPLLVHQQLEKSRMALESAEQLCQLLGIENTLKRGFTLSYVNGYPLLDPSQANPGDTLLTTTATGQLESEVR